MSDLDSELQNHPLTLHALKKTGLSYEELLSCRVEVGDFRFPQSWLVNLHPKASPAFISDIQAFAVLVWFMTEHDADWQCRDSANDFITKKTYALNYEGGQTIATARSNGGKNNAKEQKAKSESRIKEALDKREKLLSQGKAMHEVASIIAQQMSVTPRTVNRWFRKKRTSAKQP